MYVDDMLDLLSRTKSFDGVLGDLDLCDAQAKSLASNACIWPRSRSADIDFNMRLDQQLRMAHEPRNNWDYDGWESLSVSSNGFDSNGSILSRLTHGVYARCF